MRILSLLAFLCLSSDVIAEELKAGADRKYKPRFRNTSE